MENKRPNRILRPSLNPQLLIGKIFYLLAHIITINTKRRPFQCKILNNILYINKLLFKSPLFSLCKSAEETIIHLFSEWLRA